MTGVKDIIEQAQYALSSVTGIPSAILFGRAPAGMNSTGKSDLENYYNMVERIRKRILKPNLSRLIWLLGLAKDYNLNLPQEYSIEFAPLWNLSGKEKAETEKLIADTQKQKADAAKIYHDLGAIDAKEVRETLSNEKKYILDRSLDDVLATPAEE